tara:strand:+ start:160 stop:381 length:222 start_codon:yes stop_codon:yes gene_type:complete
MKKFFKWLINLFRSRYEVTVSFNHVYGDADDRTYITKKILIQKDKHLKFKDEDNDMIEFRAATGLNYIIKELR